MGIAFMIVAGAIIGWLASFVLREDATSNELQLSIAAGVAGALLAGLVISPSIGTGTLIGGRYDTAALLVTKLGAAVFSIPLNLVRVRVFR